MNFAYLLDILIAILLVTTIVWCVLLNRRLKGLRENQSELATLIAELNLAASRAEAGISGLKSNAEDAGASLQSSIIHAERINDDLAYLSERGSRLVERLDSPTKRARRAALASKIPPNFDVKDAEPDSGKREDERNLGSRGGAPDIDARAGTKEISARNPGRKNLENKLLDALKTAQ